MKRCVCALLAMILGVLPWFPVMAEEVPLLKDLRKPVEENVDKEEEPILPAPVTAERAVTDPGRLCPAGAVWYVTVPDAARLSRDWEGSPAGAMMDEPAMAHTMRNNRFGLSFLFSDLPASVIAPENIASVASVMDLAASIAKTSRKMAMACYIGDDGHFKFLFTFDIGLDRVPTFEIMGAWETHFFITNPGSSVVRGNHSGNYLDIWQLGGGQSGTGQLAEVAAGFAENLAIVSNDSTLAASAMSLLRGGDSVAESTWGRRLAASQSTSSSASAMAFLRMDELLRGLEETPVAHESVVRWADYIGHGGRNGEAIYYGLEFTADGARETFLLPVSGQSASASLVELLAKRLRSTDKWTTPVVIPYQPNPIMFVAVQLEGRQLGGILRSDRRLFGSSEGDASFTVPAEARALFSNDMMALLTGEVGIAFFPPIDGRDQWIMVLPCTGSPERLLPKANQSVERTGAVIHSNDASWRNSTCWATISGGKFRRITGDYLVIVPNGDMLLSAIDQLQGGSSFSSNREFSRALSQSEDGQGMIFYINTPEILVRQYPNLSAIMRELYPRSSGLNSRPPLAMLRRYAKGVLGVIAPATNGEEFTRVTVQAPLPTLGALAANLVLTFPKSLRQDGRQAMELSRENMKNIWLRLQLYASRYGHFPDSLTDLAAEMRSPELSSETIRVMFTAPAALSQMEAREASDKSYLYLSGITPTDEPDLPILYEAQAWSHDFAGMYPTDPSRNQSESGDYIAYRQYVRLDGKVVTMPEKQFVEKVLPRLKERE